MTGTSPAATTAAARARRRTGASDRCTAANLPTVRQWWLAALCGFGAHRAVDLGCGWLLGQLLGRARQLGLQDVDRALQPDRVVRASLHDRPLVLLDQLTELELEPNGVIGEAGILHE